MSYNDLSFWGKLKMQVVAFFGLIYFLYKNKFDLDATEDHIDECLIKIKRKENRLKYGGK